MGGEDPHTFSRVLRTLCLAIPCASLAGLLRARLQRDLDFRAVALSELVSVLTFVLTVTLLLFWRPELGVLVPVIGSVVRELGLFSSLALSARWLPRLRFRLRALRQILRFALNLTGFARSGPAQYQDRLFFHLRTAGGHGPSLLQFGRAIDLAAFDPVGYDHPARLLPDLFDDRGRRLAPAPRLFVLGTGLRASTGSSSRGDIRLCAGDCRLAQHRADVDGAAPVGRSYAFESRQYLGRFDFYGQRQDQLVFSTGHSLAWGVLIPALYFYGLPRGVEGVASVIAAAALLFLLLSQFLVNRLIGLPFATYLAALSRPGLVVAFVFAVLLLARPLLPWSPLAVLVGGAALGVGATLAALFLFTRDLCRTYWQSLRGT